MIDTLISLEDLDRIASEIDDYDGNLTHDEEAAYHEWLNRMNLIHGGYNRDGFD